MWGNDVGQKVGFGFGWWVVILSIYYTDWVCSLMLNDFVSVIYSECCIWLLYLFYYEFFWALVYIEYYFVQICQKKHSHHLKAAIMVVMIAAKVCFSHLLHTLPYFYILEPVTKFFSVHNCLWCNVFFL